MLENVKSKSQVARVQKVNQLIKRGDWKQAYKEARFLYRTSPDSELQQLMELSLWNWIKNQVAKNQLDDAKTNAKELLQIKVLSCDVLSEMPAVFVRLGMNSMLPDDLKVDTKSPEMQITLIDQFLVNNVKSNEIDVNNLTEAELVLKALQLVEQKRDAEALELLRPISFKSPLAEWRLFVRGLAAHYGSDYEKRDEAWKRLSDVRPPRKIAAGVCAISKQNNKPNVGLSAILLSFVSLFTGKTTQNNAISKGLEIINGLKQLIDYKTQNRNKELVGRYNSIRELLKSFSPEIFERVRNIVWSHLFSGDDISVLKQFIERNLPLPLDPRGNRTLALKSNDRGYINYFLSYIRNDIDIIKEFSPEMKTQAKGIIFVAIARSLWHSLVERSPAPGRKPICCERCISEWEQRVESWKEYGELRSEIENYVDEAIAADPTFVAAYVFAEQFCMACKPDLCFEEEAMRLEKKLLDNVPNHLPTLIMYLKNCVASGNLEGCSEYYDRILEVAPLSRQTMFIKFQYLVGLSRFQIDNRRFDDAAKTIETLSNVRQDLMSYQYEMELVGLRFSLAALSGDTKTAMKVIDDTVGKRFEKRITALFAVLIESTKRKVSDEILAPVKTEWEKELTRNCNGNAAGTIGSLIGSFGVNEKLDAPIEKLCEKAMEFVSRSTGIKKWNSERDLVGICHALRVCMIRNSDFIDKYDSVFQKQASMLIKLYPESAFANFFYAESLLTKTGYSEYNSKRKAMDIYRKVLDLCRHNSGDFEIDWLTQLAGRRLEMDDNSQSFDDWDGTGKHSYSTEELDEFDDDDMFWDDDEDEDDDDNDDKKNIKMPVFFIQSIFDQIKTRKLREMMKKMFANHKPFDMLKPEDFMKLLYKTISENVTNLSKSEMAELEQFVKNNFGI